MSIETEAEGLAFQDRVKAWLYQCFPAKVCDDRLERRDRLVEEALELAQTLPDFTADRAHALVDYVFGRPAGTTEQEIGGVSVTLAALCVAEGVDQAHWAEAELDRISKPATIEKIRAKQAAKPVGSALPIATLSATPDDDASGLAEAVRQNIVAAAAWRSPKPRTDASGLVDYAQEASEALTRLSGGGAEMFKRINEEFYADPNLCIQRAEEKQRKLIALASTGPSEAAMVVLRRKPDGTPSVWCDPEIADLVAALNNGGVPTVASCSGHGHRPGTISLADGRELIIARDYDEARSVERKFPGINGEAPLG